jgi:hypothetical protein
LVYSFEGLSSGCNSSTIDHLDCEVVQVIGDRDQVLDFHFDEAGNLALGAITLIDYFQLHGLFEGFDEHSWILLHQCDFNALIDSHQKTSFGRVSMITQHSVSL